MAYFLGTHSHASAAIEIDATQYSELKHARDVLFGLLEVENLFSILAQSYIDFENVLCRLSVSYMCLDWELEWFNDFTEKLNVSLLTVLVAANAYRDQRKSIFRSCDALEISADLVEMEFSAAYDQSFEYRLMEMMINYSKHNRLPVEMVTVGGSSDWKDGKPKAGSDVRHSISVCPFFSSKKITENRKKLKRGVVDELVSKKMDRVDIKSFLRSYIEDQARCHNKLRQETTAVLNKAVSSLEVAQENYKSNVDTRQGQADLLHIWKKSKEANEFYLGYQSLPTVKSKRSQWGRLATVSRRYVSTEARRHRSTLYSNNSLYVPEK